MSLSIVRRSVILAMFALGATMSTASAQVQVPTVTVAGVIYAQYAYQLKNDSTLTPVGKANNFDVTRAYIRALGKFPDGIQTQVTIDVDGRKAATNQQTFRLKYAFVAWTPENSALTYKIGAIHTPWLDWEEAMWDYRMQGSMAMERAGYLSSSDFGVGVDGMWGFDKLSVQAGIYNGENYNNAPGDQHKDFEARASYRLTKTNLSGRVGGLRLSGFAQIGMSTGGGARQRFIGMLSYKTKLLTVAGEYAMTQDSTAAKLPKQKGSVMSAYATYKFSDASRLALIGRVDQSDLNTDSTNTAAAARLAVEPQTRIIGGLSYTVSANLRVLLDMDFNSVKGGSPTNAFDKSRQQALFQTEIKF